MSAPPVAIVLDLPRDPFAATLARRRLRHDLGGRLEPQRLSDVQVVVSELVTNAVIHGRGRIRLRITLSDGDVSGEVIDEGRGFTNGPAEPGADGLGIGGLLFVERFTSRWGVHEGTGHIWFEMHDGDGGR